MVFGEVGDLFGCLVRLEVKRPASLLSLIALARPGAVQLQPSPALPAGSPSTRPAQPEPWRPRPWARAGPLLAGTGGAVPDL